MANPPSPEASEIRRRGRRRLLGAVTLVLLLVVFVPMILDSEPRPQRTEPSLAIPPKENVAPLPAPTSSPPAQAPAPSSPPAQAPAPSSPPAQAPAPSSRPAQSANGPGSNPPAAPKLEGFAVQVGAFRDEDKLKQARAKLEAAGVVHYTEKIEAKGGAMTRLRAGPFPTREAADAARAKLQLASIDGKVVSLP